MDAERGRVQGMKKRDQHRCVRIAFEPTRFAQQQLSDSYEKVAPMVSMTIGDAIKPEAAKRSRSKIKRGDNS